MHNELIASPDDGGLLVSRYANTNDVVISDIILHSFEPPKIMCGCAIYNTSKYLQESLNICRRKQLKIMKEKAENSRGRGKYELTQAYKSYADYAFPNNETHHPRCKNASDSVLSTRTNDKCQ